MAEIKRESISGFSPEAHVQNSTTLQFNLLDTSIGYIRPTTVDKVNYSLNESGWSELYQNVLIV